jgi:hypothetical protein
MPIRSNKEQTVDTMDAGKYAVCASLIARTMGWADPNAIDSREALERSCAAHPTLLAELPYLIDLVRVGGAYGKLKDAPIRDHQARSAYF